jgi:hypothetical protein
MDIEKIDFSKLYLVTEKKGYRFTYQGKSLKLLAPICESPFGVELFNKKEMINFHFNKNLENTVNNFLSYFRLIEKIYEQFNNKQIDKTNIPFVNLPNGFLQDINNHEFTSVMRPGIKDGVLIRTHLQKSTKFYKMEKDGTKKECLKSELKGNKCIPIFEISSLWLYGKKYGLLVYVSEVLIV